MPTKRKAKRARPASKPASKPEALINPLHYKMFTVMMAGDEVIDPREKGPYLENPGLVITLINDSELCVDGRLKVLAFDRKERKAGRTPTWKAYAEAHWGDSDFRNWAGDYSGFEQPEVCTPAKTCPACGTHIEAKADRPSLGQAFDFAQSFAQFCKAQPRFKWPAWPKAVQA